MPNLLHLVILAGVALPVTTSAQTFTTLHAFNDKRGKDGVVPIGDLAIKGELIYGTTEVGGANKLGTLFKVNATTGAEKVLYSFAGGADAADPAGGIIYRDHALWGITAYGGTDGVGTIFKFNLQTGVETVLHSFLDNGIDGHFPHCALVFRRGYFYGTTVAGGAHDDGTVFRFDPATGVETVLHSFSGRAEGGAPMTGLTYYNDRLYGVAANSDGQAGDGGVVFAINPATGAERVLHTFGQNTDGLHPYGRLLLVGDTFFGTTFQGGAHNVGTVYSLDPATDVETVLYSFKKRNDGVRPQAGVISQGGNLYGTTTAGGDLKLGTVFTLDPSTGVETILHAFTGGTDESHPTASLMAYGGSLYGTTVGRNDYKNSGTVFKVMP